MDVTDTGRPTAFKWCATLLASLDNQRQEGVLCDTTLLSEDGTPVPVHACILSAASPFLAKELFTEQALVNPYIQTTISHSLLDGLMSLVYTGSLGEFSHSEVDLTNAGKDLGITLWPELLNEVPSRIKQEECDGCGSEIMNDSSQFESCSNLESREVVSGNETAEKVTEECQPKQEANIEVTESQLEKVVIESEKAPKLPAKQRSNKREKEQTPPYRCAVCQRSFLSRARLRGHLRYHRDSKPFKCPECSKTFSQNAVLQNHRKTHSNVRPFRCSLCDASFRRKDTLKEHQRIHDDSAEVFLCRYCAKEFKTKSSLGTHEKYHLDRKDFHCPSCDMAFVRAFDLNKHVLKFHTENCPHRCEVCAKFCDGPEALRRHLRVHSGERPYVCDVCPAAFKQYSQLNTHKKSHSEERPFFCLDCSRRFKTKAHLNRHYRVHMGDKPFKCQYCEKGFNSSDNLKTHVRTHSGEKPYICSYCAKAFISSSNLKAHEKTHTGTSVKRVRQKQMQMMQTQ